MSTFSDLNLNSISGRLGIEREGLLTPVLTLKDDLRVYGRLSYRRLISRTALIESARRSYLISRRTLLRRELTITDHNDSSMIGIVNLGFVWNPISLTLIDGTELKFGRTGPFSASRVWTIAGGFPVLNVRTRIFNISEPFNIEPLNSATSNIDYALLALLGVYLVHLHRKRAAR